MTKEIVERYFESIRRGARDRGFVCLIDVDYLMELFIQQGKRCALTGIPLNFSRNPISNTASLDRIDSADGYMRGNVQWVHKDINMMKLDHSQNYFIGMCKKVAEKSCSRVGASSIPPKVPNVRKRVENGRTYYRVDLRGRQYSGPTTRTFNRLDLALAYAESIANGLFIRPTPISTNHYDAAPTPNKSLLGAFWSFHGAM